jgi:hypothetical protein
MSEQKSASQQLEYDAYRAPHGIKSLTPFIDLATSTLIVVKHHDTQAVQVVDIGSLNERVVVPVDFDSKFCIFSQDETVFYLGNKAAIENATQLMESVDAAIKYCLSSEAQPNEPSQSNLANRQAQRS